MRRSPRPRTSRGGSSLARSTARSPSCSARSSGCRRLDGGTRHPPATARARRRAPESRRRRLIRVASDWPRRAAHGRMSTWLSDETPTWRSAAPISRSPVPPAAARRSASIDGVSFVLPHAGTLAVMGPTGSGKSSLAAVLAGRRRDGPRRRRRRCARRGRARCAIPAATTATSRMSPASARSPPARTCPRVSRWRR